MLLRRFAAALSTAVLVVAIAGSGGGIAQAAQNQTGQRAGPNLSTPEAAKAYLSSLGLDPSKFVVQVGLLNYAGPTCPGPTWSCTGAALVIQIATAGGVNSADCAEDVRQCVIVQGSNAQLTGPLKVTGEDKDVNMHAHCPSEDTQKNLMLKDSGELTCVITQTNTTTGNNHAVVGMMIHDNDSSIQRGQMDATVTQSTFGDGDNHAIVHEDIVLYTHDESTQQQDGFQSLVLNQTVAPVFEDTTEVVPATGDNWAEVKETQHFSALAQQKGCVQKLKTEDQADPC
jgi:hypothetical protein